MKAQPVHQAPFVAKDIVEHDEDTKLESTEIGASDTVQTFEPAVMRKATLKVSQIEQPPRTRLTFAA